MPDRPEVDVPARSVAARPVVQLAVATTGFLLTFWAWALISPLGARYADQLNLSSFEQALVVATPVLVGSLGRIPVGALTDALGARRMMPAIAALTVLPVLFIGLVADSLPTLLLGGFFLGLGGTSFAVGVPHVNSWFEPARRGTAIGIFGAGTGGTALSAFTTVPITDAWGAEAPFLLVAGLLVVLAVVSAWLLHPARGWTAGSPHGFVGRAWRTARKPVTMQLAFLYAVGFGGFVAFSVYLPSYLRSAYDLTQSDAAFRTAGFVVIAVVARPVGGWLSDRLHPVPVLVAAFAATTLLAAVAAIEAPLMPVATIAFLGLAAALGAAAGACFALVAKVVPAPQVGATTGIVGAAGGLGGFFPPLVMGVVRSATGDYTLGYLLLAATAAAATAFTWFVVRRAES
ncbi:nitrate/nitrite transporter [Kribbella sp. NPDC050124]|uniref:nitrate/nitrite transporter n=1 Tax=Kribbella sp. NPDC050124 TaxID=3364114 RepID=UPI003793633B